MPYWRTVGRTVLPKVEFGIQTGGPVCLILVIVDKLCLIRISCTSSINPAGVEIDWCQDISHFLRLMFNQIICKIVLSIKMTRNIEWRYDQCLGSSLYSWPNKIDDQEVRRFEHSLGLSMHTLSQRGILELPPGIRWQVGLIYLNPEGREDSIGPQVKRWRFLEIYRQLIFMRFMISCDIIRSHKICRKDAITIDELYYSLCREMLQNLLLGWHK